MGGGTPPFFCRPKRSPVKLHQDSGLSRGREPSLRVCDFFEVPKNRCCKQNSYDDKIVKNSKKSQTLSEAEGSVRATRTIPRLCPGPARLSASDLLLLVPASADRSAAIPPSSVARSVPEYFST